MTNKLIILSLLFLFGGFSAEAQLLKKLKNAVKQKIEAVDGNKNEKVEKTNRATAGKEGTSRVPGMKSIPAPADNNLKLPDSYRFSYRATLRIENHAGTAEPVFYLQPDASYYARKQAKNGLTEFLVLDNQNNIAVIFAELEGQQRRMHNRINLQTKATLMGAYRDAPEIEPVKAIESKTILGYQCQGYLISTEAGTTQLWLTDQAPATLFGTMFAGWADTSGDAPFSKDSMIMEITFTSANAPEENYQMVCTDLEPETLVLNKTDYQEAL